jgi:uncharacterized protein YidB (DUF937 family)
VTITSLSSTALSSTAATAATRPTGPPPGGGREKTLQAVADKLGMDVDSLRSALKSGSTMSALAKTAGVSQDDLVSTIAATLPSEGRDGQAIDTQDMATKIANGTMPHRSHRSHRAESGSDQAQSQAQGSGLSQGLDALSSALGISSRDLVKRLTDGTGIADLLSQNPGVADQLSAAQNRGSLVDGYC